jgi:hypothetical protein
LFMYNTGYKGCDLKVPELFCCLQPLLQPFLENRILYRVQIE